MLTAITGRLTPVALRVALVLDFVGGGVFAGLGIDHFGGGGLGLGYGNMINTELRTYRPSAALLATYTYGTCNDQS